MSSQSQPRQRFAVIGDPIAHSMSPVIQNGWMENYQLQAAYERIRVPEGELAAALSDLHEQGFAGLNVTLPHKLRALGLARTASPLATRIGAANTLVRTAVGWHAENTDAPGFRVAIERALQDGGIGRVGHVLVLGAGGAAPAVLAWLSAQTACVTILNRTIDRAAELSARFLSAHTVTAGGLDQLADAIAQADLVINTTSIGHQAGSLDFGHGEGRLLVDISYGAAAETILGPARQNGWKTADGLLMLVAQAAESFALWFGVKPDLEPGLSRARRALATPKAVGEGVRS